MRYYNYLKLGVILVFIFLIILMFNNYFSDRLRNYLINRASIDTANLIEKTIKESDLSSINTEDLIILNTKSDGSVNSFAVNTAKANTINQQAISIMNEYFNNEYEPPVLTLKLGGLINDKFFSDLGPEIKIDIEQVGTFDTDIITEYDELGINNTFISMTFIIKVRFLVLIPFQEREITTTSKLPLLVSIIEGQIPRYYYKGGSNIPITNPQDDGGISDTSPEIVE